MAVLLLRHGAVPKGSTDPNLTAKGQQDAQSAAERLKFYPITDIRTSPEKRAQETAAIWAKSAKVPVKVDPQLDAWNLGAFKGKHSSAADAVVQTLLKHPERTPPGGGESAHAYWSRLLPALAPLIADDQLHGIVNHSRGVKSIEAFMAAKGEGMDKASWDGPLIEPGQAMLVSKDGVRNA